MGQKQVVPQTLWMNAAGTCWSDEHRQKLLPVLRKVTNKVDEKEIKTALIKYSEIIELISYRFPQMGNERTDWALAFALSPDWYGSILSDRLQNSMLVSALLLSVTGSYFMEPPLNNIDSDAYRIFIYLSGISTLFYVLSIMFGIFFIENAMSRAYTQSERMALIITYYPFKDMAQIFMALGSILFPLVLSIPMWQSFLQLDSIILMGVISCYTSFLGYMIHSTTFAAKDEQIRRLKQFSCLTNPSDGRLLPFFYPPDAELQPEDLKVLFQ